MIFKKISFVLALIAVSGSLALAQSITLDQAIEEGLKNNFAMKIAESQFRQSQQATRRALGALGPRLDAQGHYERYDSAPQFGGGTSGNIDAKRVSLVLSYPVDFAGLSRKSYLAASSNESASNELFNADKNFAIYQIRNAYYDVVRAAERVGVEQRSLEAVQRRLKDINKRFEVGDLPKFDVIRTESELSRKESSLIVSQNQFKLSKQSLNNAMAREIDTPVDVVTETELPQLDVTEPMLLDAAMNLRPELKSLDYQLKARKFVTYIERGGLTPSLKLEALYTKTLDPAGFSRANSTTLSATLSVPLFDSGITRAKIKAAKEDEKQIEINQEKLRLSIALEVKSALVRLDNAKSNLRVAEKTLALETEALRIAEIRYKNSEGVYLDVITGQADLTAAEVNRVNARYEYRAAMAQLQFAIGTSDIPVLQGTNTLTPDNK